MLAPAKCTPIGSYKHCVLVSSGCMSSMLLLQMTLFYQASQSVETELPSWLTEPVMSPQA